MTDRLSVLVTGVGGRSVGHQILGALLQLRDRYRVVATDADSFAFGLYEVPDRYVVPPASSPAYLPTIFEVIRRERIKVVLPGTEIEVAALARARAGVAALGAHVVASSDDVIALCFDKARLYAWLSEHRIGVPRTAKVDRRTELAAECGYPLIAKPAVGSGGSRNVAILADAMEVERYIADFPDATSNIVLQEYVGDAASEYTVGVTVSAAGDIVDSIVLRRHLVGLSLASSRKIGDETYAMSTGYSQGFIVDDAEIAEFCETLALKIGISGPGNIQLRRTRDGLKVLEVHPRFSGTTSIRASAGLNEPDLVIRDQVMKERVGRQPYQRNVAAIRAFRSLLVPVGDMAQLDPSLARDQ